jgi:NAD(P)-dependent dehydrogenase (short-subunit alcohol dehydrogenase family)
MDGKTVLVTGATEGIGHQTARELAQMGAHVLVHGRTEAEAEAALAALRTAVPQGKLELLVADFSSLDEVSQLADRVCSNYRQLDALINNAGVLPTTRRVSRDGYELTFAINHLAHFLLTNRLLPLLRSAPEGRVVTVSSALHFQGSIAFDDLQLTRGWSNYRAYSQSKLANVLFSNALARRLGPGTTTANALHPGVVSTRLLIEGLGLAGPDSLHEGAATGVYLASSPSVGGITGRYFERCRERAAAPASYNRAWQEELWALSAAMTGLEVSTGSPARY